MPSIKDALTARIVAVVKPKEPEPQKELADEYDMLMAKFNRDMGPFPFAALWPQPQESSLVKIISIINLVVLIIVMLTVFIKK